MENYGFKVLVAVGIVLILASFLFVFPYVGFILNKRYAHVTVDSINMTGLNPEDPRNLLIFAVLLFGGAGLHCEGFCPITKRKLRQASLGQNQVKDASVLIVVCSNTSRSVNRYGKRGTEFYSVIDGAFASMIILLSAVNEGIGASFVGALKMIKLQRFLDYQDMLNQ